MSPIRRAVLAAVVAASALLLAPARAAEPDAAIARAVRQVVDAQLRALAVGHAEQAFSFAAPAIRKQFGDAASFMAMVTGSYPMVVRPAATVFFRPETEAEDAAGPSAVVQVVQLRDRGGRLWRAAYQLERQPGGAWRIAGVVVQPDAPGSAT